MENLDCLPGISIKFKIVENFYAAVSHESSSFSASKAKLCLRSHKLTPESLINDYSANCVH